MKTGPHGPVFIDIETQERSMGIRRTLTVFLLSLLLAATAWADYDGPTQPEVGTDLFRDGVAEVRLASVTDGDTANFIVGNEVYPTRFLAVNTPELTHQVYGIEPWAQAAKDFCRDKLENASTIVLELDPESDLFDAYDRLLAWVWVDGELLNYLLVAEGYAWVMYLYGDYKYNDIMIALESRTRATGIRIHGQQDPNYDYAKELNEVSIASARAMPLGKRVGVTGIVTARIGNNAFIQDGDSGIYIYTSQRRFRYLVTGNEVRVVGTLSDYNNLLEIVNPEGVDLVTEAVDLPAPVTVRLGQVSESLEARLVRVENVRIDGVQPHSGRGYNVEISQDGSHGFIRVDQYLVPYIDDDSFVPGDVVTIVAPVGQYQGDYQLMVPGPDSITGQ